MTASLADAFFGGGLQKTNAGTTSSSPPTSATVRDVLRRQDLPDAQDHFTAEVQPHGVVFVVLTAKYA
jgi:hypothetical protein